MASILDLGFNLDTLSNVADTPEMFERSGSTVTLRQGREVSFKASINGVELPGSAILHDARLTRLTVLKQQSPNTGKWYHLVTGIMRPVKMDVFVTIDGQKMNIIDVLLAATNAKAERQLTRDEFLDTARKLSLTYTDGMPYFFQHFGANEEGFKKAIAEFKAAGAVDVIGTIENPRRIEAAYQHTEGVPVTAFEVGTVNRDKSRTNQGFLNLADSITENFQRIVALRKEARLLDHEVNSNTDLSQEQRKATQTRAQLLNDMSRQWASPWTGAQQRIVIDSATGKQKQENMYDPVNAPCGRFTMVVNGKNVDVDLWTNSARAVTNDTSVNTVDLSKDPF
jgi:hypothetical protein